MEVLINLWGALIDDNLMTKNPLLPRLDMTSKMLAHRSPEEWARLSNWLGVAAFLFLAVIMYLDCLRAKPRVD